MMKHLFFSSILLFITVSFVSSCSVDNLERHSETISISALGMLDDFPGEVKGNLITGIAPRWTKGDSVLVFGGTEYLGKLVVAKTENSAKTAYLTGTIEKPTSTSLTKLTIVYGSVGLQTSLVKKSSYTSLVFSLAEQRTSSSSYIDMVVYGTIDYDSVQTTITNAKFILKFGSSCVRVSCYGLKESIPAYCASISNFQTQAIIDLSDSGASVGSASESEVGTLVRTAGFAAVNNQGEVAISFAIPNNTASDVPRVITVYQEGYCATDNTFSTDLFDIRSSWYTICGFTTVPAYGGGIDPYDHVDWKW